MKTFRFFKYAGFAILGLAFITLAIFATMWLWNSLIPVLFHGPVLSFWQTAGLFILSKILLTGMSPGSHHRRRQDWDWKRKYHDKFRYGREEEKEVNPVV
jgi:hypothetical protein